VVLVVSLNVNTRTVMQAHVYSSEARGWNVSARHDLHHHREPVLTGESGLVLVCIFLVVCMGVLQSCKWRMVGLANIIIR